MAKDFNKNTALSAKPQDKPYELRDGYIRGLILRVQPSGKKTWIFELRNYKGRKRRYTIGDASQKTLDAARSAAQTVAADPNKYFKDKGSEKEGKTANFKEFYEGAYTEYAQSQILSHKDVLRRIYVNFKHLFKRDMNMIAETDIKRWQRSRKVSFETLERELTYLKACLNQAVKMGHIRSHQLERYTLSQPKTDSTDEALDNTEGPRHLTDDEEDRLRKALNDRDIRIKTERLSANEWRKARNYAPYPTLTHYGDHLTPLALLALNTGLRRGDLFDLRWSHVSLERKQIRKVINKTRYTKGNKLRAPLTIPLPHEAINLLKRWASQTEREGLVFPGKTGHRLDNITKSWKKLLAGAGIENFRFHDLRHSYASNLVMGGVDLNTVRALMGHSDIKMTLVYAHLSPDHLAEAVERVFNRQSG